MYAVVGPDGDQILLLDSEDSTSRINSECEEEQTQEAADQDTTLLIKWRCGARLNLRDKN